THHAFDVHAVAYFVKTIGDSIPVTKHLFVMRNAEVKRRQRRCASGTGTSRQRRHQVFHLDHGIRKLIKLIFQFIKAFEWRLNLWWNIFWRRSEKFSSEHVQLRGFVDALHAVLAEKVVAPGDEIVEILHHHSLLISNSTIICDAMWLERMSTPVKHLILESLVSTPRQHTQQAIDTLLDILRVCGLKKWFGDPKLAHGRGAWH